MTLTEFGERLWGVGPDGAGDSLAGITLEKLNHLGVTQEIAKMWRDFYFEQSVQRRGMPTSALRVELLDKCLELLRRQKSSS